MRFLFLGDVVGRSGREAVTELLPSLRRRWALDFVVINGENAAGGFGITEKICEELIDAGAVEEWEVSPEYLNPDCAAGRNPWSFEAPDSDAFFEEWLDCIFPS